MAQDFYAAFGLGEDERHISTVDSDGIALSAIQGLYEHTREETGKKDEEIEHLKARMAEMEVQLREIFQATQ